MTFDEPQSLDERASLTIPPDACALISDLERGGALRPDQADRLLTNLWSLPDEWWMADPFLFGIGEHSHAYIEAIRQTDGRKEPVADAEYQHAHER
jgi:hypothetical protein